MSNTARALFIITFVLLSGSLCGRVQADDGDNARFVSSTLPSKTIFTPGESVPISIVIQNSGETTWDHKCHTPQDDTAGAPECTYVLVPIGETRSWASVSSTYWTSTAIVLPGEQTSIALQSFKAPPTEGTYRLQWQMVKRFQSSNTPIGDPIPATPLTYTVSSTPLQDKASLVSVSYPSQTTVAAGQTVSMKITVKNTGTHDWTTDYYALAQTDRGTYYPFTTDVAMNDTHETSFSLSIPTTLGAYERQWRMVSRAPGQDWSQSVFFGDNLPSPAIVFMVVASTDIAQSDNAQYVDGAIPSKSLFVPGEEVHMTLHMLNTGTSTWDDRVKLYPLWPVGYQPSWDTTRWGFGGGTVAPGAQATFDVKFVAPGTLATTVLQWRLARVNSFGALAEGYFGERAPALPLSWTVVSAASTPPPIVVSQFTGPSGMSVGEQGTWTVSANDSLGRLSEVSFLWGDGETNVTPILSDNTYSLAHTYRTAGTFQIVVTAADNKDSSRKTQRSLAVVVGDQKNSPPLIKQVNGPTRLKTNQRGVWSVNALDSENSQLVFSVEWGDDSSVAHQSLNVLPTAQIGITQTAIFKHYYASNGTFTPRFVVKDAVGQSVDLSATVVVQTNAVTTTAVVNGSLIQLIATKGIYLIENSQKRAIRSRFVFDSLGFRLSDVMVVDKTEFDHYSTGPDLTASITNSAHLGDGFLIKSPIDPAVYWTANGKRQHIANEVVFAAHAFRSQDIHIVADDEIAKYPLGPDLSR